MCAPVHANDKKEQIHKQFNGEGVCRRQDDDDYYCRGCSQESWEAAVKWFISCERFQSKRVSRATWTVFKRPSEMT